MTFYAATYEYRDGTMEEIVFENEVLSEVVHFMVEEYGRGETFSILWGDAASGGPDFEVAYHDGDQMRVMYIVEPDDVPARWKPGAEGGEGMRPVLAPEQIPTELKMVMTAVRGLRYPALLQAYDHFEDLSYGNDVTDSVGFTIGEDAYVIFIEPARVISRSPEARQSGGKRFSLYKTVWKGIGDEIDWQVDDEIANTDSPDELMAKVAELDRAAQIDPTVRRFQLLDLEKSGKVSYVEPEITPAGQRAALLELNGRRRNCSAPPKRKSARPNPSRRNADDEDKAQAIEKYEQFHRFGPSRMKELGELTIPRRVRKLGDAKYVLYRSGKVDPSTLEKPSRPVDYIHEFSAGVEAYACDGIVDTDLPAQFVGVKALVHLGTCLGFSLKDGTEAEATPPLPTLACSPDGHCLFVIQGGRKVIAVMFGGALGVHPRGIDG